MENGKTDAMAPKKNAAPAEAPKSLGTTIQNVIGKAVTSPTDGKIDFAQGVNHITGDAHQKSAKPAEPMQSLKAGYDMKPKSETYEDKEEVKEADEKEKEKMMKAQADIKKMNANVDKEKEMKEGEVPAGLQKYLDKKKGNDKSEEKEDDKKKEVKEESEEEKKKELKAQKHDDKEMKEEKDEDEKEIKAQKDHDKEDEKKEIKASAKEKVKDMDMKEDVAALTDGEELSEEFKAKAATIFESAVKAKLVEEIEKLESEYETKVTEKVEESKEEIVEKVDAYLNYVVESWMKDNELAIEKGLKSEITEDFIGGMKKLFETHYIDLPENKFDVIEDQAATINKLKEEVNETIARNVELNQKIADFARDDIINDVASDLAETEKEKLKGLAESIEYVDAADYRGKVETIKNSYFPAQKASDTESNDVASTDTTADLNMSESMSVYTAAISKTKAKKLY